tara:strand:+ start:239 stop:394 length:156 start_codon:yes stop_codon:yes gene_type:complete
MESKNFQSKKLKTLPLEELVIQNDCKVSRASTEIMLNRFCDGKEIDFPFSK